MTDLFKHDHGFFLLKCSSDKNVHTILDSGPSFYNSRPIIMKPWGPDFDFSWDIMRTIPLWIRLPNPPLNCWTSDSLSTLSRIAV